MLNLQHKTFYDPIHGYMEFSEIIVAFIDTFPFQRQRGLKQLGATNYVFPTANGNRFEHALGTCWLSGELIKNIIKNSKYEVINKYICNIPELQNYFLRTFGKNFKTLNKCLVDTYICTLVQIAGLCHDIGHGPLSHVFDDLFIKYMKKEYNDEEKLFDTHEARSGIMIEYIIKNNTFLKNIIQDDEIKFIKNLIDPRKEHIGFIYQIVSNSFNNIDVDKFDYCHRDSMHFGFGQGFRFDRIIKQARVIDKDIICYPSQLSYEISAIFQTRYKLHKQAYAHKVVVSIQYMIFEMMKIIDPIANFYRPIKNNNLKEFLKLDDGYIFYKITDLYDNIDQYNENEQMLIKKAYTIYENIQNRNLMKFIKEISSEKKILDEIKSNLHSFNISDEEVIVYQCKLGYVGGNKENPLDNIHLYKPKSPDVSFKVNKHDISYLTPNIYQEYVYMIYVKDKSNIDLINKVTDILSDNGCTLYSSDEEE